MKPVLTLRHVPHEGLGIIENVFRHCGVVYSTLDVSQDCPRAIQTEQLAGLVVMGGPMNVDETDRYPFLAREVDWIREAVQTGVPVLGICLGSQLLAKALGSNVYPNRIKEIGWYEIDLTAAAHADPLFAGCRSPQVVFQWHGDTFDLPDGAVHLAESAACRHQAFRYGESAYGLQFHLEVTTETIDNWLGEPGNCGELAGLDYIDPEEIRRRTPELISAQDGVGQRVFSRFASLCRKRR